MVSQRAHAVRNLRCRGVAPRTSLFSGQSHHRGRCRGRGAAARVAPVLTSLAPEIWVAEAPLRWLGVEVGRRMTVIRLSNGELLVHSPAELTADLRDAFADL